MSSVSDYQLVLGSLRVAAVHPRVPDGIDISVPLAGIQTFLCPSCPCVHLQVDTSVSGGGKIRVGLRLEAEDAEALAHMLTFPPALREEEAEDGLK